jgi:hypothetical protein
MPISVLPVWVEVKRRLRELGIEHHNQGIEAGMMMEVLMAEFLAMPDPPDGWVGPHGT